MDKKGAALMKTFFTLAVGQAALHRPFLTSFSLHFSIVIQHW